jgi:trehalose 6-phosphate synthase
MDAVALSLHPVRAEELVSYYRSADIALLTPLRDGMNLVAKEFVASRVDDDGVLESTREKIPREAAG